VSVNVPQAVCRVCTVVHIYPWQCVCGSHGQVVGCMFPADSVVCVFPIGGIQRICSAWAVNSVCVPYN
jgi:hypothetical protein